MRARRRFIATAVLACTVLISFVVGQLTTTNPAQATASHVYTLRVRDRALIPAIGQRCAVNVEGGAVELFCAKVRRPRHQVTIFRDNILVWKVGNPDSPEWSGKP